MNGFDPALIKRNQETMSKANPLFNRINQAWEKTERFFQEQGIFLPVSITYYDFYDRDGVPDGVYELGIHKIKGKWRICHGVYFHQDPSQMTEWTPINECNIELRVEMLKHVSSLFQKLVEANEAYVAEIEQAVAKADEVLANLGLSE